MGINFENGKIIIDLANEENQAVWMVVKEKINDKTYVAMVRDIFGDMTLSSDQELLETGKYLEDEAEKKCIEWSEKLGLEFYNK